MWYILHRPNKCTAHQMSCAEFRAPGMGTYSAFRVHPDAAARRPNSHSMHVLHRRRRRHRTGRSAVRAWTWPEKRRRRRRRRRRTRGGGLVPLWLWMPRALAPRVDRKNAGRRCAGAAAAADPSKPRRVRENTGRSRGRRRTPREQRRGSAGAEACPTARGLPPSARVGLLLTRSPATNDALPHTFAPRRGSSSRERGREE
ncbi:unnamed protein product [Prorocentrum cordatum]|uniref:Uncharacterized protein n=1 Tax=Prorocentrum cordatum TaxID=2364126 RepID=A0ABN9R9K2_9DINO|nr:unnamed protein product [Polarella glacialis]